ncbi:MAG TPA: inositol monophosphatase family protein [Desulfatiglandales bacterium]|nr:inositol monophosphatase family protein [Desulfatiglandales bacterium]
MVESKSQGIEDLKQFAVDVIRRSGEEALSYYGKGNPNVKFDEDLVTEAEIQLTEFFQKQLHNNFPEHQILENNQTNKGYTHEGKRYLWIYNALEGVANFQAGVPVWGISLALLDNFWPVLSVFYMPAIGDLFYAQAGQKAFRGNKEIRVSAQESINDESLLLTYSRFHHHYHSTFPGKIRDMGCTAAHICYTAMGSAEAAVIFNESYRGLAAIRVIVEEAGGKIGKMDGSEFSLDEYLDGQGIEDRLIVGPAHICSQVPAYLQEIS